jgi:hypothetical protein
MFIIYKVLSLTILGFFLLTMTLVPLYSSIVMVKLTKASQEGHRLDVPKFKDDGTASKN